MLEIGDALEEYGVLPESLAGLMDSVLLGWRSSETPAADDLLHAKETVWRTLDTRNGGDSTAIRDQVDRSMRAALCLTELTEPRELLDIAAWAAQMLSTEPWPRQNKYF